MDNALDFLLSQAQERENQAVLALNQARVELDGYYQQLCLLYTSPSPRDY